MREQSCGGPAAADRQRWGGCLHDRLARPARALGSHVAHHPEPAGHVVQHLGHVLAERAQAAAAGRAGVRGGMHHHRARQVAGQGAAGRSAPLWPVPDSVVLGGSRRDARLGLQVLQRKFELLDLGGQALGAAAELHPAQARELQPQPVHEQAVGRQLGVAGGEGRVSASAAACAATMARRASASSGRAARSRVTPARWPMPPRRGQ